MEELAADRSRDLGHRTRHGRVFDGRVPESWREAELGGMGWLYIRSAGGWVARSQSSGVIYYSANDCVTN